MDSNKLIDYSGKSVLLIGNLTNEMLLARIKGLGYSYINKMLSYSNPENWYKTLEIIRELKRSNNLVAVFIQFTTFTMLKLVADQEYTNAWQDILYEIREVPSLIFIHETHLSRNWEPADEDPDILAYFYRVAIQRDAISTKKSVPDKIFRFSEYLEEIERQTPVLKNKLHNIIDSLLSLDSIALYKKRTQMVNRALEFLDDLDTGVIFRLYIPKGHFQANQINGLLRLFEDYMNNIEQKRFSIDQLRTNQGTIYIFKSIDNVQEMVMEDAISQFNNFMELAQNDIQSAREILRMRNLTQTEVDSLLARYVRDYRRIKLDSRQELESRMLDLKHRLESELLDISSLDTPVSRVSSLGTEKFFVSQNFGTINLNYLDNVTFSNQVEQKIFEETFLGDVKIGMEDREILNLFQKFGNVLETVSLNTALMTLKDSSISKEKKQTSWQKIEAFLLKIMPIVGETVIKGILDYIKAQYLLS